MNQTTTNVMVAAGMALSVLPAYRKAYPADCRLEAALLARDFAAAHRIAKESATAYEQADGHATEHIAELHRAADAAEAVMLSLAPDLDLSAVTEATAYALKS